MRIRSLSVLCAVAALVAGSCGEDAVTPPAKVPPITFKDLKNKDDVLFNLELAYNERSMTEYSRLLDDAFVFVFSPRDFSGGHTPQQWDRDTEIQSHTNILNPNLPGDDRVVSINLNLYYDADAWIEEPPTQDHPDESWFKNIAGYKLSIKTANAWEMRTDSLQAEFTVRWAGTQEDGHWRIVLWRDAVR